MNSKFSRLFRLPSLLLAAALQVMPLVRAALPAAETATNVIVILFRWIAGSAAALGGIQAVSGASTRITNPLNVTATNGQPFNLRLTTAPDQAHYWLASNLPPGLTVVGTAGLSAWSIQGAPTVTGSYAVGLTAKDQINSGRTRTVTATLSINILSAGAPPTITTQPVNQSVTQGQTATFTVAASGVAPFHYQWRRNGTNLVDSLRITGSQTDVLSIAGTQTNDVGSFTVVVSNPSGSTTSQAATLTVTPLPPVYATLVVNINGSGAVNPDYNGQSLQVGNAYSMTATPTPGNAFSGWTGGTVSSAATLIFTMRSNLVLQANFVPVTNVATAGGAYVGLFSDPAGAQIYSSGSFMAAVTARGKYSARIVVGGRKYSWTGRFDATGRATNLVNRGSLVALGVELQLDRADPDVLRGQITAGTYWSAQVLADRAVFDGRTRRASQAGSYTMNVPGTPAAVASPAGDGFAIVAVGAAGRVRLAGVLADGSRVAMGSIVSKNGDCPVYAPLYRGAGVMLSWQTFTARTGDDFNGTLIWIRGPQPSGRYYPAGFAVQSSANGSRYEPPTEGTKVLNFGNGQLQLSGGNLAADVNSPIRLNNANQITTATDSAVRISIALGSGVFRGSVIDPATGRPVLFMGVLLQKSNSGHGFFLGPSQSGDVYLGP